MFNLSSFYRIFWLDSHKVHLLQQKRRRQMRRASRRSEQVTVMPIVPVSLKPFFAGYHVSSEEIMDEKDPSIVQADPKTHFLYVTLRPFLGLAVLVL